MRISRLPKTSKPPREPVAEQVAPQARRAYTAQAKSTDHGTPTEVFECALLTYGLDPDVGQVDFDPCASLVHTQVVRAKQRCTGPEAGGQDGLQESWKGLGFMNSPYGRALNDWTGKAFDAHDSGEASVIQLAPFIGAEWMHDYVLPYASAICVVRGRLTFRGSDDPFPKNSCVILWGYEFIDAFAYAFGEHIPKSLVCRKNSKTKEVKWVPMKRPIGTVLDLRTARYLAL